MSVLAKFLLVLVIVVLAVTILPILTNGGKESAFKGMSTWMIVALAVVGLVVLLLVAKVLAGGSHQ